MKETPAIAGKVAGVASVSPTKKPVFFATLSPKHVVK